MTDFQAMLEVEKGEFKKSLKMILEDNDFELVELPLKDLHGGEIVKGAYYRINVSGEIAIDCLVSDGVNIMNIYHLGIMFAQLYIDPNCDVNPNLEDIVLLLSEYSGDDSFK